MGIYHLLKFCSENENQLISRVDLTDIARDRFQRSRKNLVILVDYVNFLFFLCEALYDFVSSDIEIRTFDPKFVHLGGQYDLFDRLLRSFIRQFRKKHIEFRFFVDGEAGSVREEQEWKKHVWIQLFHDYADASSALKQVFQEERSLNQVGGYFLPPLLDEQVRKVLRDLKCEIIMCEGEADGWIAKELYDNPEIFAVFANDSDFLIMPKSRVILNDYFDVPPISCNGEFNEIKKCIIGLYNVENLEQLFDVPQSAFSELAILSGNDMTKPFIHKHRDLFEKIGVRRQIADIANFVMSLPTMQLEDNPVIKDILDKDEDFSKAVTLARKFYSLEYINRQEELLKSETGFKRFIQDEVFKRKLPKFCSAVLNTGTIWRKGVLEDTAVGYAPCQHVLSSLRSIIYKILGCSVVTEYGKTPKDVCGETKVRAHSSKNVRIPLYDETIRMRKNERQDLFLRFIDHVLSPELKRPCPKFGNATLYILRYLVSLNQRQEDNGIKLREHEFDSLLCMLLILREGPPMIPTPVRIPCNMRCISVGSCFQAVYKHLVWLSQVLSLHRLFPDPKVVFDGQLFTGLFMSGLPPEEARQRIRITEMEKTFLSKMVKIRQNVISSDDFTKAKGMTLRNIPKRTFELPVASGSERLKLSTKCTKAAQNCKKTATEVGKFAGTKSGAAARPDNVKSQSKGTKGKVPTKQKLSYNFLPINEHRDSIVTHIRENRVTYIEGQTGCGKSTMVPLFLLEDSESHGEYFKLLITQPRRIAAVTLAERVSGVVGSTVADLIGYQIGGESHVSGNTHVTYATTGYFLQSLINNPSGFCKYTHVILDEVHERDLDTDLLSLIVKQMLYVSETKLIVMSATLQGDLFMQYFSEALKIQPESPIKPIFVGVKNFTVEEIFLEDITSKFSLSSFAKRTVSNTVNKFIGKIKLPDEPAVSRSVNAEVKPGLFDLCRDLISMCAEGGKTILIFLPGLNEIEDILDVICVLENDILGVKIRVSALHSNLSREEQQDAFQHPSNDTCRIVLATNIAESSITLPEVNYVIDFGLQKELFYDVRKRMTCLRLRWCSHAASQQRAGRTGRVCSGTVIRFYTKSFFDEGMPRFDPPEMEQAPLDKLVLKGKYLIKHTFPDIGLKELLSKVIQPPEVAQVNNALELLASLGALSQNSEDANVTLLGQIVTVLPVDVSFGRLVVFGTLFGMTCDAVVMAVALSSQTPFSMVSKAVFQTTKLFIHKAEESLKTRLKYDNEEFSEPIMVRNLFVDWLKYRIDNNKKRCQNYALAKAFCADKAVIPKRLLHLEAQVLEMLRRTEKFIGEMAELSLVRGLIRFLEKRQHSKRMDDTTRKLDLVRGRHELDVAKTQVSLRRGDTRTKDASGKLRSTAALMEIEDHIPQRVSRMDCRSDNNRSSEDACFKSNGYAVTDQVTSIDISDNISFDRSESLDQLFCQDPCVLKALLVASFPTNIAFGNASCHLEERRFLDDKKKGSTQNYAAKVQMEENGFNPKKSVKLKIKNGENAEEVLEELKEIINISKSEVLGDIVLIEFDDVLGNIDFFGERSFKDERGFTHVVLDRPPPNFHEVPYTAHTLNMLGSGRNRFSITSVSPGGTKDHSDQYIEGPLQPYLVKWMSRSAVEQGVPHVFGKQEWRNPGGFLCDTRDTRNGLLAVVPSIVGTTNPMFAWFDGLTVLSTVANGCLTWIFLLCFLPEGQNAALYLTKAGEIYGLRIFNKELTLSTGDQPVLRLDDLTAINAIREEVYKQLWGGEDTRIAKSNVKEMLDRIITEVKSRIPSLEEGKSKEQKKRKEWLELDNRRAGDDSSCPCVLQLPDKFKRFISVTENTRSNALDDSHDLSEETKKKTKRRKKRKKKATGDQSESTEWGKEDPFLKELFETMGYPGMKFTLKQLQKAMRKYSQSVTVCNLKKYENVIEVENINDCLFVSIKLQENDDIENNEDLTSFSEAVKDQIINMEDGKQHQALAGPQDDKKLIGCQCSEEGPKADHKLRELLDSFGDEMDIIEQENGNDFHSDQELTDCSDTKVCQQKSHEVLVGNVDCEELCNVNNEKFKISEETFEEAIESDSGSRTERSSSLGLQIININTCYNECKDINDRCWIPYNEELGTIQRELEVKGETSVSAEKDGEDLVTFSESGTDKCLKLEYEETYTNPSRSTKGQRSRDSIDGHFLARHESSNTFLKLSDAEEEVKVEGSNWSESLSERQETDQLTAEISSDASQRRESINREDISKMEKKTLRNEKRFLSRVVSVLLFVEKPMTVSYLSYLIGEWKNMTIDLKFLSKNLDLFVVCPLDNDWIIQLKHLPKSSVKRDAYLQRHGLPKLKVAVRKRVGKLTDLLRKEAREKNKMLGKIENSPMPVKQLVNTYQSNTSSDISGVGFFLRNSEDFRVFSTSGKVFVSRRLLEDVNSLMDNKFIVFLERQTNEEFIIQRVKFMLTNQLSTVSVDELQYLRMGQCTVNMDLLRRHADLFVVSNGDQESKKVICLKRENKEIATNSECLSKESSNIQLVTEAIAVKNIQNIQEESKPEENDQLGKSLFKEQIGHSTVTVNSNVGRKNLQLEDFKDVTIKIEQENLTNEKLILTQVMSILFAMKQPLTLSYLSHLIGEWGNMTVDLQFVSRNSALFVINPLDGDLIIQSKVLPEPGEKRDGYLHRFGLPKPIGLIHKHVSKVIHELQKHACVRKVVLCFIKNSSIPLAKVLNACQSSENGFLTGVDYFLRHTEDFKLFKTSAGTFVSRRDPKDLTFISDDGLVEFLDSQTDEEFITGRIKFMLTHQVISLSVADLQNLRMGQCTVNRELLRRNADLFSMKDDLIFLT